jgi:putative ABC transport system ATP-binding protein
VDIKLSDISKSFTEGGRQARILTELNVTFPSGRFSVVLGKSGSGKSTLLNLISGIDTPDSGAVRIGDINLNALSDRERTLFRRRHIGFVFQFFNLISTLSVIENVTLIQDLEGVPKQRSMATAEQALQWVGLLDRRHTYPDQLSGGEQQRVAIARAIAHRPAIILADEPTGNLDLETGARVLNLMLDLIQGNRTTLIMATHSSEVLARADYRYRIQNRHLIPSE